jgi:hypothetical protein
MDISKLVAEAKKYKVSINFLKKGLYNNIASVIPENEEILYIAERLSQKQLNKVPVIVTRRCVYMAQYGAAFAVMVLLTLAVLACSGTPTLAPTETKTGPSGTDLDTAIREAAAQMEAKIPSNTIVALVSMASPSTAFSMQVLARLESAIVNSGKLIVVDRTNLDKIREEQGFQLSGEVDDESAKSIGRLLGAASTSPGWLSNNSAVAKTVRAMLFENGGKGNIAPSNKESVRAIRAF